MAKKLRAGAAPISAWLISAWTNPAYLMPKTPQ
jgi:hypothetical protein